MATHFLWNHPQKKIREGGRERERKKEKGESFEIS